MNDSALIPVSLAACDSSTVVDIWKDQPSDAKGVYHPSFVCDVLVLTLARLKENGWTDSKTGRERRSCIRMKLR